MTEETPTKTPAKRGPGRPKADGAKVAKPKAKPATAKPAAKTKQPANTALWTKAGFGAAVGSAAVVAALLYVNRGKKKPDDKA